LQFGVENSNFLKTKLNLDRRNSLQLFAIYMCFS